MPAARCAGRRWGGGPAQRAVGVEELGVEVDGGAAEPAVHCGGGREEAALREDPVAPGVAVALLEAELDEVALVAAVVECWYHVAGGWWRVISGACSPPREWPLGTVTV